jgi:hypothetical protein
MPKLQRCQQRVAINVDLSIIIRSGRQIFTNRKENLVYHSQDKICIADLALH